MQNKSTRICSNYNHTMEGTGSLYSSKETITSPVKSFMDQHKHIQLHLQNIYDGDNTTTGEEQSNLPSYLLNLDKLKEIAVSASNSIKNVVGTVKDKFNEARSKIVRKNHDGDHKDENEKTDYEIDTKPYNDNKDQTTSNTTNYKKKKTATKRSRIFVTRSSKEFAQIQIDNKFSSSTSNSTTSNDAFFLTPLVGAAVVALPYALKQSGLVLGILLILFVIFCMDYGEMLLIQCVACSSSGEQQPVNIVTVSRESFGRIGYLVYFGFPFMFQFCILMAYFVIVGDTGVKCVETLLTAISPRHFEDGGISGSTVSVHRNIVIVVLFLILLPLSMIKSGKWIARFSYLSLIAGTLVSVLVTVRAFTLRDQIPRISMTSYHVIKSSGGTQIVQAVAVVVFTFLCQHTVRLTYMKPRLATNEVDAPHNPPDKPADLVSAFLLLINMTVSCGGYATFNVFTQGNVLENYCEEDLLAGLTRVVFTVFVASLFSLECMNLRLMTDELVLVHYKFKNIFNVVITCVFLLPIFITSLFIDCLPLVLEATGVLLAIPITFVLPSLLFLKQSSGNLLSREKIPCLLFMSVGIALSVTGFAVTVFSNHSCIHSSTLLPYCNGSSELVGPLITLMSLHDDVTATTNFVNDDALLMMNFTTNFTNYINMSRLEQYGFENLTDVVNAYLA